MLFGGKLRHLQSNGEAIPRFSACTSVTQINTDNIEQACFDIRQFNRIANAEW